MGRKEYEFKTVEKAMQEPYHYIPPGQFTKNKEMKSVNNHPLCHESHRIFSIIDEMMLKDSRTY